MNTPSKTAFFRAILVLFGVIALIGSSVAPALAERDEPGKPMDLRGYCNSSGLEVIIHPQDMDDPDGRSWRCATVKYTVSASSNSSCTFGAGVEVQVKKLPKGTYKVECTMGSGRTVEYEASGLKSIDINAVCAWQYQEYDASSGTWVVFYEADSYDWSDPYALGCYSTLPEF